MSKSLKRKEDIVESLCADATKRRQHLAELEKPSPKPHSHSQSSPQQDKNHANYVFSLFMKRFDTEFALADRDNKGSLDYDGFAALFQHYGCITKPEEDGQKLKELWTQLGAPVAVPKETVAKTLRAIMRVPEEEQKQRDV